jgi:hypothetical protein
MIDNNERANKQMKKKKKRIEVECFPNFSLFVT